MVAALVAVDMEGTTARGFGLGNFGGGFNGGGYGEYPHDQRDDRVYGGGSGGGGDSGCGGDWFGGGFRHD